MFVPVPLLLATPHGPQHTCLVTMRQGQHMGSTPNSTWPGGSRLPQVIPAQEHLILIAFLSADHEKCYLYQDGYNNLYLKKRNRLSWLIL